MRHAFAIARRELRSYFASPLAYVAITIFAFVSGMFYSNMLVYFVKQAAIADQQIQKTGASDLQIDVPTMVLRTFFDNQLLFIVLVLPLLTMGLLADERRRGTLELLLTSPVRSWELVAGKFSAALALFAVMLLPTLPYFGFLATGGDWEPGVVLAGYVGMMLVAAAGIGVGLWISSLCDNVLVSAFLTYGVLLAFLFVDTSSNAAKSYWVKVVNGLSFYSHYSTFPRGIVALNDVLYFATFVTIGLFLAQRTIEAIRFKRS
jgi:ABC-2 type transport system permease protein